MQKISEMACHLLHFESDLIFKRFEALSKVNHLQIFFESKIDLGIN